MCRPIGNSGMPSFLETLGRRVNQRRKNNDQTCRWFSKSSMFKKSIAGRLETLHKKKPSNRFGNGNWQFDFFKAQSSTQQCCDSNFRPKNQHENFTHHELAELFNRDGLSFFSGENRARISSQSKATSSRKWSKPTWVHPVECLLG